LNRAITAITITAISAILLTWAPSTAYAGGFELPPLEEQVDKIEALIVDVDALQLNNGIKNSLTKKLVNAIKNIENEDPIQEACEKLQSFIDQLNALVNAGKLTPPQVETLIDGAASCIDFLCN